MKLSINPREFNRKSALFLFINRYQDYKVKSAINKEIGEIEMLIVDVGKSLE